MSNDYGEPIFHFQHYGGACPECQSTDTAIWMREINEPDKYPTYDEWLSCHDCKHTWNEPKEQRADTYLLNNVYGSREEMDKSIAEAMKKIEDMIKRLENEE